MALVTRNQMVAVIREVMDAQDSIRWSESEVVRALNTVFDQEWSNILNAAPHYTFGLRSVTTDSVGRVAFSALDDGTGDTAERFYRILSVSDGNALYTQTAFERVPLSLTTNYLPQYPRLYYLVGSFVQTLPAGAFTGMQIAVNWKPPAPLDLSSGSIPLNFPENNELLLAYAAGAQLLNKGGTESVPARELTRMADAERASLLDDLRRRTINPTRMAYPDHNTDWAGY
jgi:hypothetical protein